MYRDEAARTGAELWSADIGAAAAHNLEWVEGVDREGLSVTVGRVHTGGNSGYQALGLAYQLGASYVVLLGFDMQASGTKIHWHGDHPACLGNSGPYDVWAARFVQMAVDLIRVGVRVVNATRSTALEAFEKVSLDAALGRPETGWKLPILVRGMSGLGDNLYQRPVIAALAETRDVYLQTPWPQLYRGLAIGCVRVPTRLRTQARNAASVVNWATAPAGCEAADVTYTRREGTMLGALARELGVDWPALKFTGPRVKPARRARPYLLVRPATVRTEWVAESRNPDPTYIARAVQALRAQYHVISVADLAAGLEWAVGELPYADERHHAGELSVLELMALVAGAAGVIGGVGWLVPAAVAYKAPMLLIFGGAGIHNGPGRIFDPRMDISRIVQAVPDKFCICEGRQHGCDKTIRRFDAHVEEFAHRIVARKSASMAARAGPGLLPRAGATLRPELLGKLP